MVTIMIWMVMDNPMMEIKPHVDGKAIWTETEPLMIKILIWMEMV